MAKRRNSKQVRCGTAPVIEKTPRGATLPASEDGPMGRPVWRFGMIDHEGPWKWEIVGRDLTRVMKRLGGLESQTFAELRSSGDHHSIEADRLSQQAKKRLRELQRDDIDQVWSFRVTARKRVIALIDDNVFNLLWWDPEHEVCPSNKKHT